MHNSHNSALAANVYFSSNSGTTPQHNLQGPGLVMHGTAVKYDSSHTAGFQVFPVFPLGNPLAGWNPVP